METTSSQNEPLPHHQLGRVAYALDVPALSLADYVSLQAQLLKPLRERPRWRFKWSLLVWVAISIAVGWLAGMYDWSAELWVGMRDVNDGWLIGGRGVIVLGLMLLAIGAIGTSIKMARLQLAVLPRIHREGGQLFGAHRLLLGDGGIYLHNSSRTSIVPWSAVTDVVPDKGVTFIMADRVSAFWLQESLLASLPDRAAFMAYVKERMAAAKTHDSAKQAPPDA